jgi:hypothetical protein
MVDVEFGITGWAWEVRAWLWQMTLMISSVPSIRLEGSVPLRLVGIRMTRYFHVSEVSLRWS